MNADMIFLVSAKLVCEMLVWRESIVNCNLGLVKHAYKMNYGSVHLFLLEKGAAVEGALIGMASIEIAAPFLLLLLNINRVESFMPMIPKEGIQGRGGTYARSQTGSHIKRNCSQVL